MRIIKEISKHGDQVLPHQLLMAWLVDYHRPNDKIQGLKKQGLIVPLKKGVYMAGPAITDKKPDSMVVANHLLGPSYVSLDTALSFYGMIPERVYEISSMTSKASRTFSTPLGKFTYTRLPLPYYSFGLAMHQLPTSQYTIVATKEKALCDKIVTRNGLTFRSIQSAHHFLLDNLRIDASSLKALNTGKIKEWLEDSPKRESLMFMVKMIEQL